MRLSENSSSCDFAGEKQWNTVNWISYRLNTLGNGFASHYPNLVDCLGVFVKSAESLPEILPLAADKSVFPFQKWWQTMGPLGEKQRLHDSLPNSSMNITVPVSMS